MRSAFLTHLTPLSAVSGSVHLLSVKTDKIGWITGDWPAHHCPVTCLAFVPHTKDSDNSSLHLLSALSRSGCLIELTRSNKSSAGSEDSTVCVWRINMQSRTKLYVLKRPRTGRSSGRQITCSVHRNLCREEHRNFSGCYDVLDGA